MHVTHFDKITTVFGDKLRMSVDPNVCAGMRLNPKSPFLHWRSIRVETTGPAVYQCCLSKLDKPN